MGPHGMHPAGPPGVRPHGATAQVAHPPYLASQTAARMGAPQEPWADSLKTLMLVFGVALIACFVLPWALAPKVGFSWDVIRAAEGKTKLVPLLIGGTGLLALVLSLLPLAVPVRGGAAAAVGFVPLALGMLVLAPFHWHSLFLLIGALTLVSGLLIRSAYHSSMVPRVMVTVGVVCLLIPMLVPDAALIDLFKGIGSAPGKAKVGILIALVFYVLAITGLILTWLPTPSAMGTNIVAWLLILWPLVIALLVQLVLAGHMGERIKTDMFGLLWSPVTQVAWAALLGYGVASLVGKSLEHS
jgi:hypothetical protein